MNVRVGPLYFSLSGNDPFASSTGNDGVAPNDAFANFADFSPSKVLLYL